MALSENQQLLSKIATNDRHGENSPYFDGWKAYDNNPYHPIDNREGVIQMGLAENQLCFDLIQKWIRRNPKASICTAEGVHEFKNIAIFLDYHGFKEFRQSVANFMRKARGGRVTFDPNRIVMSHEWWSYWSKRDSHVLSGQSWRCFPCTLTMLSSVREEMETDRKISLLLWKFVVA